MGEIGCYSMMLYCDSDQDHKHGFFEMPHEYTGPTREYCLQEARKVGWLISRTKYNKNDGTRYCLCPKHSKKKRNK